MFFILETRTHEFCIRKTSEPSPLYCLSIQVNCSKERVDTDTASCIEGSLSTLMTYVSREIIFVLAENMGLEMSYSFESIKYLLISKTTTLLDVRWYEYM